MELNSQLEPSFMEMDTLDTDVESTSGYEELYNCVYYDYNSLDTSAALEYCINNPSSLLKVNVPAGISVESLAYKLYSDKNYWDLIMILNNKEMLNDMPKTNDLIEIEVEELVNNYFKDYQGNKSDELIEAYTKQLLENKTTENTESQSFIILNPSYQKQFLRSVKYT